MKADETYKSFEKGSEDLIAKLVEDHMGWATAIAKSVARAWNMDWQLDGLDGGAYEGLLFCANRYDPSTGVPFRAYARRRIHEAATEEARKSKTWQRGTGSNTEEQREARELSARLLEVFPEIRDGLLPASETKGSGEDALRVSIRSLLSGASILTAFQNSGADNPEISLEYKRLVEVLSTFEAVHQEILCAIYWKGISMRGLAKEWGIDELSIIREHREILKYLSILLSEKAPKSPKKMKIRRGLRAIAMDLKKKKSKPPFEQFSTTAAAVALLMLVSLLQEGGLPW